MIKKIVFGLFITLATLALTGSLFVYFNKDVIVHGIQNHLKKSGLDLDMAEIDVQFIKSFPSVSANINQVSLATSSSTPLLSAGTLSFNLDLARLLSKEVDIKEIIIQDGHIRLLRDRNGKSNYSLISHSESSNQSSFELNQVKLINMDFTFRDEKQHHLIRLKDVTTTIKPAFNDQSISAELRLSASGEAMSLSEIPYFFNQQIRLNSLIKLSNNRLSFESTTFSIGENKLHFHGEIAALNTNHPKTNITLTETTGKIEALPAFLPASWFQILEPYDIKGYYKIKGSIKGKIGHPHIPLVSLIATLQEVELKHEALLKKITQGSGELFFLYGSSTAGKVELPNFNCQYIDQNLDISFDLNSFSKPRIKTVLNGVLNLKDLNPEIIPPVFIHRKGQVSLNNFTVESMNNKVHYQGQINAKDLVGLISGIGFEVKDGHFTLDDQKIDIAPTKILALEEEHRIEGTINLSKDHYNINLYTKHVDLNKFFTALNTEPPAKAQQVNETKVRKPKIAINLVTDELEYNHIVFDKTKAKINWTSPTIHIKSKMEYCKGIVNGTATYNTNTGKTSFRSTSDHIDMKLLFEQWNNFEQDQITSKHIRGFGDIQCSGSLIYNTNKQLNTKSMKIIGGVQIKKGQLHNVPVFQQFSSYVKVKDLAHIKFNSLSNVFKIENGTFYLPEMFIQSNAANIILAGNQTLDNNLNYAIKVNAGQILTNKIKKHDIKLRPSKAKNRGFFNLHYIVKGPIDNFEYFANRRRVLDKFEQSLFMRDEIIEQLNVQFDIEGRYESPHLFQEIPEMEIEEGGEVEYLRGFER